MQSRRGQAGSSSGQTRPTRSKRPSVAIGQRAKPEPRAVRVGSNVRVNGVFLNEGEQVDQVDPETGVRQLDLLEDERAFEATEVERKITAPDSNRKIIEELKAYADESRPRNAPARRAAPADAATRWGNAEAATSASPLPPAT